MDLKQLGYDFKSNFLDLDGNQLHYIDEGEGDVILMLHGNPTWSFYYRNAIRHFSKNYRVIVPDHMGCGFSDKPENYEYTLEQRVQDIKQLLDFLGVKKFKMVVHDWGGAIGFGVATQFDFEVEKIVILNTAAFTSDYIPWQIDIVKRKPFGPLMVKYMNAFCLPATFMTTVKKLPRFVKKAYLMPYSTPSKRKAVVEFVQDIPMNKKHPSYDFLKTIENSLIGMKAEKMIVWGKKDFCFNDYFLNRWKEYFPGIRSVEFTDAGHYVLEDKATEALSEMEKFFG